MGTRTRTDAQRGERRCELCGRRVARLARHHLIPRARHAHQRERDASQRRERRERIAWLCAACHKQLHVLFSEKELERHFDSVAKLRAHPEVQRFVRWVRRRPDGTHVVALRTRRRRDGRGPR